MLNAKQMADEIRAYPEADSKDGLRLLIWHAVDTKQKTRPVRMLWPDPVSLSEKRLTVQSGNIALQPIVVEYIDLTAPVGDARLARHIEQPPK